MATSASCCRAIVAISAARNSAGSKLAVHMEPQLTQVKAILGSASGSAASSASSMASSSEGGG
ncbi:MAG: hypothetical protein ACK56I_20595, partial [bacterium]